jgi:hypothetical protein
MQKALPFLRIGGGVESLVVEDAVVVVFIASVDDGQDTLGAPFIIG